MTTGVVTHYDADRGYGFLRVAPEDEVVFVHFSALAQPGDRTLTPGTRVRLTVVRGPKGPRAVDVQVIAAAEPSD